MKLLADVNVEKPIIDYLVGIALDVLWIPDYNCMLPDEELLNNEIYSIKGFEMTERNLLKRIVIDSQIMLGKPVIKGTRLPIEMIVEKMAYGKGIEALLKDYPFLEESDVRAALLYAAKSLANEEVFAA